MQRAEYKIEHIPFLRELGPRHGELLAGCAREQRYRTASVLLHEGEMAKTFHLVLEGEVAIEVQRGPGERICIQTLGPDDVVGWSWMTAPYLWHFTARCRTETRTLDIDAEKVRNLMERDHDFGYALLKAFIAIVTSRLESARLQLLDLYGDDPGKGRRSG